MLTIVTPKLYTSPALLTCPLNNASGAFVVLFLGGCQVRSGQSKKKGVCWSHMCQVLCVVFMTDEAVSKQTQRDRKTGQRLPLFTHTAHTAQHTAHTHTHHVAHGALKGRHVCLVRVVGQPDSQTKISDLFVCCIIEFCGGQCHVFVVCV